MDGYEQAWSIQDSGERGHLNSGKVFYTDHRPQVPAATALPQLYHKFKDYEGLTTSITFL